MNKPLGNMYNCNMPPAHNDKSMDGGYKCKHGVTLGYECEECLKEEDKLINESMDKKLH